MNEWYLAISEGKIHILLTGGSSRWTAVWDIILFIRVDRN